MQNWAEHQNRHSRRQFFGDQGIRLGSIALASMAGNAFTSREAKATSERVYPPLEGLPHFAPKAKAVIYGSSEKICNTTTAVNAAISSVFSSCNVADLMR